MAPVRRILRIGFERVETWFDAIFGAAWNPFYFLGALGYFYYWIVAATGIYLYVFFDTGVTGAYQSVEALTHAQWYAGGVMRSLHRYASDALVVIMMVHLVREFALDRYRGARWFSWITGVPILWFVFACGISGYWLVWDTLAQYIAVATTEWFDTLGIFGEPIARNFLNQAALSDRFFTLMVFIHIAGPLLLLLVMWIHLQRMSRAKVNPPRGLAVGTLIMLLALSFAWPAVSQGPADLDKVPTSLSLDWFYLPAYPLTDLVPGLVLWGAFALLTAVLIWMPWLPPRRHEGAAVVDLEQCNGCGRCTVDCPFNAVVLAPRSDDKPFTQEASVNPALCTSCGICVGACPPSTPFRRTTPLTTAIDLPGFSLDTLRERTLAAAAKLAGDGRVLVYGCGHGPALREVEGPGIASVALPCVAMLPPSFVDFAISRGLADGVMLTGCRKGDCHFRQGIDWTEQRVGGTRDPYLRKRVPRERIAIYWAGLVPAGVLQAEIMAFRARLKDLGPLRAEPARTERRTDLEPVSADD